MARQIATNAAQLSDQQQAQLSDRFSPSSGIAMEAQGCPDMMSCTGNHRG